MMNKSLRLLVVPFGIIAMEDQKVVKSHKFDDDPKRAIEKYRSLVEKYQIDGETVRFLKELSSERRLMTRSAALIKAAKEGAGIEIRPMEPEEPRISLEEVLVEGGFFDNAKETAEGLREAFNLFSIQKIREDMEDKDRVIINAINAYDEYTEIINIMYERLREWYGLHFPELERYVKKYATYARLVARLGSRENFTVDELLKTGLDQKTARKIHEASSRSMGIPLSGKDLAEVVDHAKYLVTTIERRDRVEEYVEETLREYAPNITKLLGHKLAGKLIARAGGLRRLATLPASTIQLLGAEKALFRALRKGTKPPKHGIIFQHPAINRAPRKLRGKIARALASKIAIAVRVDVFGTEDIGDRLKQEFEEKVKEIYRKFSPKKVARAKSKRRGGER